MGEEQKYNEMFNKSKKVVKEIKQCHSCGHLIKTVCQNSGQVVKPNSNCSAWSN